jgi:hypothetical protein
MNTEETLNDNKNKKLEEIKKEILTLQAEAHELKVRADKLIEETQDISNRRLDKLERMQSLAREHESIKRANP